jgi:CelD/BcsL family acetyltransferase involved in cellulose biosynthesis
MQARFFSHSEQARWDAFCAQSYGSTFQHTRQFLSYHGDRLVDRSMVIEHDGQWVGVLPAAWHPAEAARLVSHPGATFGGIVHSGRLRGRAMIEALASCASLAWSIGARVFEYKVVPHIYHQVPAQDDVYALWRIGASLSRCDLSSCIDLEAPLARSARRVRAMKKARKGGLEYGGGVESAYEVWPLIEDNLWRKHAVRPTHTLEEIIQLAEKFPNAIEFVQANRSGEALAALVTFRTPRVVHAQYIASAPTASEWGALDGLFEYCIANAPAKGARYFDFGISTTGQGRELNDGLCAFKNEFGASGLVHQFFELRP